MQQNQLIHFPVNTGSYTSFVDHIILLAAKHKSSFVCLANVHMFIEAYRDRKFIKIIRKATIVTPDGIPLTWGLERVYGIKQERVSGMDLLPDLLQTMTNKKLTAYFYGGSSNLLKETDLYLKLNYPLLKVAGFYSPPFRILTKAENENVIKNINHSNAHVVFVVLGCPKQEKWMGAMKGKINACMIGIGGALPVMIGLQKRAPKYLQRNGLEWVFRFCQEPGRLFRRYLVTNVFFVTIQCLKKFGFNSSSGLLELCTHS